MPEELAQLRYEGIGLGIALLLGFAIFCWSKGPHLLPRSLVLTWSAFALSCATSSFLNHELIEDSVELFWLLFCVPLCLFLCGAVALRYVGFKTLIWALAISHLSIIVITLAYDPALRFRYMGLLGDPNQLGLLSLMGGLAIVFYIPPSLISLSRHGWKAIGLTALLIGSLFLIVVSSHRTSLLTMAACFALAVARFRRLRMKTLLFLLPCTLALGGFASNSDEGREMLDQLITKHASSASRGQILDGREDIWRFALENASAFGHGRQFFVDTNRLGAHNSFLHILGTRGAVATFFLVILCAQSLYFCFVLCRDRTLDYDSSQGVLLIVSSYWLLSMAEGMFSSLGTGIHIGFLMTFGYAASLVETRRRMRRRGVGPLRRLVQVPYMPSDTATSPWNGNTSNDPGRPVR